MSDLSCSDRSLIDKAIGLLSAFGDDANTGVGVSELARRTDLSKSTAHRVLGSLERNGVVERVGTQYRLGERLLGLANQTTDDRDVHLRDTLTPFLAELYELTHETVHLAILRGPDVVYLNKLYGRRPVPSPSRIGGRAPAYCTGIGKSLLAYDVEALQATLRRGLVAWTENTLSDPDQLEQHLARIREQGVALDHEESRVGLSCIGTPIFDAQGRPVAAFSIAGPTDRFDARGVVGPLRRISHAAGQALAASFASRRMRAV